MKDRSKFTSMADPLLEGNYPKRGLYQALAIAAMCLHEEADARPLMADVVTALEFLAKPTEEKKSYNGINRKHPLCRLCERRKCHGRARSLVVLQKPKATSTISISISISVSSICLKFNALLYYCATNFTNLVEAVFHKCKYVNGLFSPQEKGPGTRIAGVLFVQNIRMPM